MINQLYNQKSMLEENLRKEKKKLQQIQKNWIQASQRNVCLEQDFLALKSQYSKLKIDSMKKCSDFSNLKSSESKKSILKFVSQLDQCEMDFQQAKESLGSPCSNHFENMLLDNSFKLNQVSNDQFQLNQKDRRIETQKIERNCLNNLAQKVVCANYYLPSFSNRFISEVSTPKLKQGRKENPEKVRLNCSAKSAGQAVKTLYKLKFQRKKSNIHQILRPVHQEVVIDIDIENRRSMQNQTVKGFDNSEQNFNLKKQKMI